MIDRLVSFLMKLFASAWTGEIILDIHDGEIKKITKREKVKI